MVPLTGVDWGNERDCAPDLAESKPSRTIRGRSFRLFEPRCRGGGLFWSRCASRDEGDISVRESDRP